MMTSKVTTKTFAGFDADTEYVETRSDQDLDEVKMMNSQIANAVARAEQEQQIHDRERRRELEKDEERRWAEKTEQNRLEGLRL